MNDSWKLWCLLPLLTILLSGCDKRWSDLNGIREHGSTGNLSYKFMK